MHAVDARTIALSGIRAARGELCRADGLLERAIKVAATQGIQAQELAEAAGTSRERIDRIDRIVHGQAAVAQNARGPRFATSTDTIPPETR